MGNGKKLYTIGDISKICSVPIKTLRYYDKIGLLTPSRRDNETNYRYYTESQMLILHNIKKLQSYGFSLDEIRDLIFNGSMPILHASLEKRLNEIRGRINSLQSLYNTIEYQLSVIDIQRRFKKNSGTSESETISVEDICEKKILYTRFSEENYDSSHILIPRWLELFSLVRKNGLNIIGSVTETYFNQPLEQFLKKQCDMQIAIPVSAFTGNYTFFKIQPAFKAVTAMHFGSYENIINTHVAALKWLNSNGYEVCGPIMQEYIISPADVKSSDDFLTKIIIPVKKN